MFDYCGSPIIQQQYPKSRFSVFPVFSFCFLFSTFGTIYAPPHNYAPPPLALSEFHHWRTWETSEMSLSRLGHNFLNIGPFLTIFAPLESSRSSLSNGATIVKNGTILRRFQDICFCKPKVCRLLCNPKI